MSQKRDNASEDAFLSGKISSNMQSTIEVIASLVDRDTLLSMILDKAAWTVGAKSGGIYEYCPVRKELTIVADHGRPEHVRGTLKLGEGLAGRLVQGHRSFRIVNNYNRWAGRANIYEGKRLFGAVLEIVLKWQERIVGVLYVDDSLQRKFTERDARILMPLANEAATILGNLDRGDTIHKRLRQRLSIGERLRRWERLSQISHEIVGGLSSMGLEQRLTLIAERATEIMKAESCGICLVNRKGFLSWEANYSHGKGVFHKGREFKIVSAPRAGLTSHIAKGGKLFNVWDEKLTGHWAVRNSRRDRSVYESCYSLLALPLKKGDELIGLLRVENKLGEDRKPRRQLRFTEEDEWILNSFGQAVVVAIEEAKLVEDLERLVTSSPNGIIAVDIDGNITTFNEKAEEILGYKKAELLGTPVSKLYFDPKEARRIGRLLHSNKQGKFAKHPTFVKTKNGWQIPILLSATWLYDSAKKPVGSVGYFEDQRWIQQKDRHLDLLLKSSKSVAQAKTLDEGLKYLAKEVVSALNSTFCRILLLDERGESLVPKAAYPIERSSKQLKWMPGLNKPTPIKDWLGLTKILEAGKPEVLSVRQKRYKPNLIKLTNRLRLKNRIESLLIVPLKIEDQVVGLLHVGELRRQERTSFSEEKIHLASAVADQTAALIHRTRLFEISVREGQLLTALDEALGHIRAEKEPAKLLQEFVRLAAELVDCNAGGVYINHPRLKQLELAIAYGIPDKHKISLSTQDEGLVGLVARSGETQVAHNYTKRDLKEPMFELFGFKTMVAVPLHQTGKVEKVLFVADSRKRRMFARADLLALERFAARASTALHTSEVLSNERRMADRLRILHDITYFIQAEDDLEDISHAVLTGITAGYGLGFNRATLFVLGDEGEYLIGREAIGQLTDRTARKAWNQDQKRRLTNFTEYRKQYKKGNIPKTPLGKRIKKLRIPVRTDHLDPFSQALLKRSHILVEPADRDQLPKEFVDLLNPTTTTLIIPLLVREKPIGLLTVDNKFTQSPITPRDSESLLTFANTVATSFGSINLFQEAKAGHKELRSLYTESSKLPRARNPYQVLHDIVAQTRAAAGASWVSLVLIDEYGQARNPITAGARRQPGIAEVIRPKGISMQVMDTGVPVAIEDTTKEKRRFNPKMFEQRNVAAALCLPLSLHGARIGVVWIHYAKPHVFSDPEVDALQLYVNRAAIAYDTAARVEDLKRTREAAEALIGVTKPQEVIDQIVRSARAVLQANSVVFWYYDNTRGIFLPEQSRSDGITKEQWEKLKQMAPRPFGAAHQLFDKGLLQVKDINNEEESRDLGPNVRRMLGRIGARRFMGVALSKLGVMYINYDRPRSFSPQEQESVRAFANHAALALKTAKLLDQVNQARNTAKLVAELTTLENANLDNTLVSVVEGTQSTLDCDAVTLYVYSPDKGKLSHEPVMAGVKYPKRTHRFPKIAPDSIIFKTLRHKRILVVSNTSTHPLLKDSRFAKEEKIESCVAIPLRVGTEKVGVMFVNYHAHHRFTREERTNIELLAHQASVAIRNAQLYERQQKRAVALQALYEAGQAVTRSLDETEILNRFADQVELLTNRKGDKKCFVDVKLVEGTEIKLAVSRPESGKRPVLKVGIDLKKGLNKRIGIVGRAVKKKKSQIVGNVEKDPDYIRYLKKIRSEIVVPIKLGNEVIGVINVEHPEYDAFDKEDQRELELFASQASSAIRNARSYANLQQTLGKLSATRALAWVGMASSTWGHNIVRYATTINDLILLARDDLKERAFDKLENRFVNIQRSVERIQAYRKTAPLSSKDGVESVPIVELIEQRIKRSQEVAELQNGEKTIPVDFEFDPKPKNNITVRASSGWLNIALDVIIDNAIEAMTESPRKRLRIGIQVKGGSVEIRITDTGQGIPPEELPFVLRQPIPKSDAAKGSGIGLLNAQEIFHTYGGDICIGRTSPKGTTMIVFLPVERRRFKGKDPDESSVSTSH